MARKEQIMRLTKNRVALIFTWVISAIMWTYLAIRVKRGEARYRRLYKTLHSTHMPNPFMKRYIRAPFT